jgi:hypothetical protein
VNVNEEKNQQLPEGGRLDLKTVNGISTETPKREF